MSFALAVRVSDGIDVGVLARQATRDVEMEHKEAAMLCGLDAAGWYRGLEGHAPLDLWKLRHLPLRWWQVFIRLLADALIADWWANQEFPFRQAKADLRAKREKEQVS